MKRSDGRDPDELRSVTLTPGFMPKAEGSCLAAMGDTKVICTATVRDGVPRWMEEKGAGWLTAEYSMLPRSGDERIERDVNKGRISGRAQEIQRLIGRGLRAVTDLTELPGISIIIDCDVLQGDGGTRTAAITGGFVALAHAISWMRDQGKIDSSPLHDSVAAVSVGIVAGTPLLDLRYEEDSRADVDMNIVMTGGGKLVEVQGTAEKGVFDRSALNEMLDLGTKGIEELAGHQKRAVGGEVD
jgi:ribonuclease PH